MITYRYTARDEQGATSSGLIEASDEHQAADILRARKLLITSLEVKRQSNILQSITQGKVSGKELATVTRQLSTMITAGLPLTQSLEVLSQQVKNKLFKQTLKEVIRDIDGGTSFSKSLEKHPQIFSRLYVSLITAGEASGNLEKILAKLADGLETQAEFNSKIKGALIYPAIILVAMGGVITIMMVFVVPQMKTVYESLDADLPFATVMLVQLSDLFTQRWYLLIAMVAAAVFGYRKFSKTLRGQYLLADYGAKVPIFGKLTMQTQLTQFIETLGLLISSGVPILDALDISKETLTNIRYQEAVASVAAAVEKGSSLAAAVEKQPVSPIIVPQMIAIGEQTGKLDEVLIKVGDSFEQETSNTVKNLSTAMEPLIMIFLGVSVGFLIFALITPIYGLLAHF